MVKWTCFLFSIIFISVTSYLSFSGIDLTDEGYYLNWISNPQYFRFSALQFGFVYHPLYLLFSGNVGFLRIFNIFLLIGPLFFLCKEVLAYSFRDFSGADRNDNVLTSLALFISLISFVSFRLWLLTPNYNTLVMQGIALAAWGSFRLYSEAKNIWLSRILIAVGGVLAFLAKPTSAAFLLAVIVVQILLSAKKRGSNLAVCGFFASLMVLGFAYFVDGSLHTFFMERILIGAKILIELGSHSADKILRIDNIPYGQTEFVLFFVLVMISAVVCRYLDIKSSNNFFVAGMIAGIVLFILFLMNWISLSNDLFIGVFLFAPIIGSILASFRYMPRFNLIHTLFCVCIAFFAYTYAVGTNNNYWLPTSGAGIFVLIGCISFFSLISDRQKRWNFVLVTIVLVQLVSVVSIGMAIQHPYRQGQSLMSQSAQMHVASGSLKVSDKLAKFIEDIRSKLGTSGFRKGTPMIDLTGASPGVLFLVEAKPLGHPWILGGFPGSDNFFTFGLSKSRCDDIATAWIITAKGLLSSISPELLENFGLDFESDYLLVNDVTTSKQWADGEIIHEIYRPNINLRAKIKNCEEN